MGIANETGSITLGGQAFPVRAFTLDELQAAIPLIGDYYAVMGREGNSPATIAAAKKVLAAALRQGEVEVGNIPANADEVWLSIAKISEVAGLISLGERLKALMQTLAPSTGTGSTPT